jgi:hypothetical protein
MDKRQGSGWLSEAGLFPEGTIPIVASRMSAESFHIGNARYNRVIPQASGGHISRRGWKGQPGNYSRVG